jgi:glycosyltransferase involved in cell wall biosynthesis
VHVATQALASFLQRHRGIHVQLLDWGDLKEQYRQQYKDCFEFIPRCPPDKVEHLIRRADVIVGQFALGVLGVSELQAMSCAKPVVCSHRYAEAYPDAVPIRHADTAEEIEAHLEQLFQHPEEAADLGQKARTWVMRYHDHTMLSITLEKLYQSIIKEYQE